MAKYPMTEVIARREFSFVSPEGPRDVLLSIGRPAPFPDAPQGDWYCPWRIEGPDRVRDMYAGGVDELQALLLAISGIRAQLALIASRGQLTWLEAADLGLELVNGAA